MACIAAVNHTGAYPRKNAENEELADEEENHPEKCLLRLRSGHESPMHGESFCLTS